jgi:hypothetical protein
MSPLRHPLRLTALLAALFALAIAGTASAQITIGEVGAPAAGSRLCILGPYDNIPAGASAPTYTVPSAGVITSWSNQATEGLGQLLPNALNTFPVDIPVKAGDLIGDNDVNAEVVPNACLLKTADPGDAIYWRPGSALLGSEFEAAKAESGSRMNVRATLLPAPTISAVTPGTGKAAGGTAITITGTEFAGVKGVTVGTVPVPFTVLSEGAIAATTSAGIAGAATPVTVSTIAGTATTSFAYEPVCEVPKLKGRMLKPAKRALRKAHCKPGKVTRRNGVTAKTGKVVEQSPKQGTSRPADAKVSLKLG